MSEQRYAPKAAISLFLSVGLGAALLAGCGGSSGEKDGRPDHDGMITDGKPRCIADGVWMYPWEPARGIEPGPVAQALGVAVESVAQGGAGTAICPEKLDPKLWEDRKDTLQIIVADPIYNNGVVGHDVTCLTVGSNLPKGEPSDSLRVVCPKVNYIPVPSSPVPTGF